MDGKSRLFVAVVVAVTCFGLCWVLLAVCHVYDTGSRIALASVALVIVQWVMNAWAEQGESGLGADLSAEAAASTEAPTQTPGRPRRATAVAQSRSLVARTQWVVVIAGMLTIFAATLDQVVLGRMGAHVEPLAVMGFTKGTPAYGDVLIAGVAVVVLAVVAIKRRSNRFSYWQVSALLVTIFSSFELDYYQGPGFTLVDAPKKLMVSAAVLFLSILLDCVAAICLIIGIWPRRSAKAKRHQAAPSAPRSR